MPGLTELILVPSIEELCLFWLFSTVGDSLNLNTFYNKRLRCSIVYFLNVSSKTFRRHFWNSIRKISPSIFLTLVLYRKSERDWRWRNLFFSTLIRHQCDQMARLYFSIFGHLQQWTFANSIKIIQSMFKILTRTK